MVVLKYKSPAFSASPSLSVLGSLDFAPKYVSSKLSKAAAAAVADDAAAVADDAAAVAEVEAFDAWVDAVDALDADAVALLADAVALVAEAVALVAALVALVVAAAASTIRSYFALFTFVVSGWEPELVWAVLTIKMLLVLVSLTRSRCA